MIQISHHIQVYSKPAAFFDFYKDYDKNFAKISPDNHIRFEFLTSPPIQVGTITLSEEVLLGKHQKIKHKIVELTEDKVVLKGLFPLSLIGGKLMFKIETYEGYFILYEILEFGFKSLLGELFNPILRLYLKDKYDGLNNHSKESLLNIKKIIENSRSVRTVIE